MNMNTNTNTITKTKTKTKIEIETKVEPNVETKVEIKTETKVETKSETEADTNTETGTGKEKRIETEIRTEKDIQIQKFNSKNNNNNINNNKITKIENNDKENELTRTLKRNSFDNKKNIIKGNETEYESSIDMGITTPMNRSVEKNISTEKERSIEKNKIKDKKKKLDLSVYAWQFKANTINWWLDHPFKDIVYTYELPNTKGPLKKERIRNIKEGEEEKENKNKENKNKENKEQENETETEKENKQNELFDVDNIKEINKILCETLLPKAVLQLIERKYAYNIAINFISIILKTKPEYNSSAKRLEYFRKMFEKYERVKWTENKSILYIEDIYKTAEIDVKKCITFMIEIISPYYFRNQDVILKILKEFKKYYTHVYPIVYNVETYLYMLKEKENEKDMDIFINDDFSRSCIKYSVTFSIYYSLLFKLENLIEMLRKYINQLKTSALANASSKVYSPMKSRNIPSNVEKSEETKYEENSGTGTGTGTGKVEIEEYNKKSSSFIHDKEYENEKEGDNLYTTGKKKTNKEKMFARYLTMENPSVKRKEGDNKLLTAEEISEVLNMFLHDYLYLLLLPPAFYHPLAHELLIHKPDKDFTDFMARDIKSEILTTLSYTNPYKTGNLMCSCCFHFDPPANMDFNTNIAYNKKIYLNPYYDNISTLEDLVNIYRIYERCGKTIDLYNFFIYFLNIKIDKFLGYSIEEKEIFENVSELKENLFSEMLQEYYLRFIIAVSTFCSFFKIIKPPNVSALLNYDDKDFVPEDYTSKGESTSETSVAKFLSEIRKSLQGCTSKKLLFGKYYYNKTIISREFLLMRAVQAIPDLDTTETEDINEFTDTQQKTGAKRRKVA